ncbi:hypothetical protein CC78DRAFT_538136 [Lojkania enalia]|uniref:AA9 family lytic polysaccharide monooxygenase n=1 Tax=Lojkania enalia TaxID=147567 RepID=A0A9P4JZP4_9PLEO|nr:hypothetical protein CC78DRAFT_538136 [Didymosphaeria enalia]
MKTFALAALVAYAAPFAAAHATVFAAWINDVDQGLGNSASGYIRSPPNNDPIVDVTSTDMTCNKNNAATAKTLEIKGGDQITFEWHHNDRSDADDIIASSHLGPVMTYIAPTSSNGEGDVWIKLAEDGFDGDWAVNRLIANRGKHSITLPDLAAGEYLLRPEIIALHEGNREGGAQFYMECVQIKVTSSGSKTLPAGVAIPGAYKATDPGVLFDIYSPFSSYPIPGPAVWDGASGGDAAPAPASSAAATSSNAAAPVSSQAPSATSAAIVSSSVKTTLVTIVKTATKSAVPAATSKVSIGVAQKWYQCGGKGFPGPKQCAAGLTCVVQNPYYSQCL